MNLYEITDLATEAIDQFDAKIAHLSYAQINSLLLSLPLQPVTIQSKMVRNRLIALKELIETDSL